MEGEKTPVTPKQSPLLGLLLLVVVILFVSTGYLAYQNMVLQKQIMKTKIPNSTQNSTAISLPKNNLVVYTRCFGGERQLSSCKLYVSGLKDVQERLIYSFDFPQVQQTDFESGFSVNLNGVIDKKAVYIKTYWEKNGNSNQNIEIFGFVDLATGVNTQINHHTDLVGNSNNNSPSVVSVYLDNTNKKIYYSTATGPGANPKVYQYDLNNNNSNLIIDSGALKDMSQVLCANSSKLYLYNVTDFTGGGATVIWRKTYDLSTKVLSDVQNPIKGAVFDQGCDKIAYVNEDKSTNTAMLTLKVSDIDGSNTKIINSTTSSLDPFYKSSTSYFSDIYFNTYGDRLSYTLVNKAEKHDYISFLEIRKTDEPNQKGIMIFPPDNPDLYKTVVGIVPQGQAYKWVKYLQYDGSPFDGNSQEGVVYEANNAWYLKPLGGFGPNNQINLVDVNSAILTNAKNVFVLP